MKIGLLMKAASVMFIVMLCISAGSINAQSRIWTIEDCVNYAVENNLQVKQSELDVKYKEVDLLETKLRLLPNLNANASFSYNWGRVLDRTNYTYTNNETNQANFGLDASMRIFGGLQYQNTIRKAKIDFQASQYAADQVKDDITLLLTQAYLNILYNKELLKVASEQVAITKEQIKRTEKLVDAGILAMGSLLEIQAQGAAEEITEITYENSLALAYLDLLQILDLPGDTDFEIYIPELEVVPSPEIIPVNQVFNLALGTQPGIKSAELLLESAGKNVAIAQGARSPVINLQSGWNTNYSNQFRNYEFDSLTGNVFQTDVIPFNDQFIDNQSRYLGVGLSIPIFNGYMASSNIARAKIAASSAEYNLEITKNTLRKSIEQAYYDAQAAYKSYQATQKSLSSFQESFRYTEQKFTVGMATSVDYNLAKTQMTAAESDLLRTRFDYIFKLKILDFYMGKPITLQ
ncbi:MAG TPA: TolC family protein [Bacteroidales bacterium]|nr:TolC family protein [Bacteroidales bacterium]